MASSEDNVENMLEAEQKLSQPLSVSPQDNICLWSDLLGFGKLFFDKNWHLSHDEWDSVKQRLFSAHSSAIWQFPMNGNILILNDGIAVTSIIVHNTKPLMDKNCVKIYDMNNKLIDKVAPANSLLQMSLFICNAVLTHLKINRIEKEKGFPGTRSIIAFGQCVPYIAPEISKSDFSLSSVFKTEKGDNTKRVMNDPTIVFNPYSLQMNTAFSKAYMIESIGSRGGITGNNLYIDESVIVAIKSYAHNLKREIIEIEEDGYIELRVLKINGDCNDVILGLRLSKPIVPKEMRFSTNVYRLLRFYPHDEYADQFWFDLEDPVGYGPKI